jgi:hypothetical protein
MNRQQGRWREGVVGRKWRDRLGDRRFTAGKTTSDHSHDERSSNGEARQTRRSCGFPATACEACKYGSIDLGQSCRNWQCAQAEKRLIKIGHEQSPYGLNLYTQAQARSLRKNP